MNKLVSRRCVFTLDGVALLKLQNVEVGHVRYYKILMKKIYLETTESNEMHPHRVDSLVVSTVLIIMRGWYTVSLNNMR